MILGASIKEGDLRKI